MAKRVPRFIELIANERDQESNDSLIFCRSVDGEIYRLQIDESMLIPMATALMMEADRATPSAEDRALVTLPVKGFATGLGPEGDPGIRFQLVNGAMVGIALPANLLGPLREKIADLEVVLQREARD